MSSMDQVPTILRKRYPLAIDDGRGFLPDQIAFGAPVGMRADIRRAAASAGTSCAAFMRAALVEKLQAADGARA